MTKARTGAMSADETDVVAEREQLLLDRFDQGRVIAARQIATSDRTVEQDVADMGKTYFLVEEHHASRRVTGAVQNIEVQFADANLIVFLEPAVWSEVAHTRNAKAHPARHHIIEQELVGDMRALDSHFERIAQFRRASHMVDMAVGQPDFIDRDAGLLDRGLNLRNVATGIDHDRLHARGTPQQGAVLLEQRDRDDDGTGFRLGLGFLRHASHNADFSSPAKENLRCSGICRRTWSARPNDARKP